MEALLVIIFCGLPVFLIGLAISAVGVGATAVLQVKVDSEEDTRARSAYSKRMLRSGHYWDAVDGEWVRAFGAEGDKRMREQGYARDVMGEWSKL
jgi:hypothetical protein